MALQMKYPVRLSVQDREWLERLTTTGVHSASMIRRARVLLALDTTGGEVGTRDEVAARAGASRETVRLIAKRFADNGGDVGATIERKQREHPPVPSPVTADRLGLLDPAHGVRPMVAAAAGEARRAGRGHPGSGPLHHRTGLKKRDCVLI